MFTLHSDGDSELDHELAGAADLQAGRLADRPPNRVSVICSSDWSGPTRTPVNLLVICSVRDPGGTVRTEDGTGQRRFFSSAL